MVELGGWAYEDKYQEYKYPEGYCPKCGLGDVTYGDPLAPCDGVLPHGQMIVKRKVWANEQYLSAFGQVEHVQVVKYFIFNEVMVYRHCDTCGHHWCYLMHEDPK